MSTRTSVAKIEISMAYARGEPRERTHEIGRCFVQQCCYLQVTNTLTVGVQSEMSKVIVGTWKIVKSSIFHRVLAKSRNYLRIILKNLLIFCRNAKNYLLF